MIPVQKLSDSTTSAEGVYTLFDLDSPSAERIKTVQVWIELCLPVNNNIMFLFISRVHAYLISDSSMTLIDTTAEPLAP